MAIKRHLIHINNHTLTEGVPAAPQANDLMHGEIAVNYGEGGETLFIKNDKENANEIVKFSSDKYWQEKIENNELTTSAALNDLNTRLLRIEDALDLENKTIEYGTITVDGQIKNVIMWV